MTPIRTTPKQPSGHVTASVETNYILSTVKFSFSERDVIAARCAGDKSTGIFVGVESSLGTEGSSVGCPAGAQAVQINTKSVAINKTLFILIPSFWMTHTRQILFRKTV